MDEKQVKKKAKEKKMSYSKLNVYDSCAWKYYLTYELNHFTFESSLSSELGTLIHSVEENIFKAIKEGREVDYNKVKDYFNSINIPKKDKYDTDGGIFGLDILKEKYKKDFYQTDELGRSYYSKTLDYISSGVYRLQDFLKENPDIVPFEAEKFFSFTYRGYVLSGYIDRIFYDKAKDMYIIEDIKTKAKPFKEDDLKTPLQFVIYCMGLHECLEIPYEKMDCFYNLPILNERQHAGTKGFIERGITKINKILDNIEGKEWKPDPSPLCYWCPYSASNPNQPEGGKNLCPYYSLYDPDDKSKIKEVKNKWEGLENHEVVMLRFLEQTGQISIKKIAEEFDFDF